MILPTRRDNRINNRHDRVAMGTGILLEKPDVFRFQKGIFEMPVRVGKRMNAWSEDKTKIYILESQAYHPYECVRTKICYT